MPAISYIAARTYPEGVIGVNNTLPWRLKSDLRRFKKITSGYPLIMGRNTFESIGRPLPNRANIVLSRSLPNDRSPLDISQGTPLIWVTNPEDALFFADFFAIASEKKEIFVIGGEGMYSLFEDQVAKAYITDVFANLKGDAFFKMKFPTSDRTWKIDDEIDVPASDDDEYPYRFTVYRRRDRKDRYRFVRSFFTDIDGKAEWLSRHAAQNKEKFDRLEAEAQIEIPLHH